MCQRSSSNQTRMMVEIRISVSKVIIEPDKNDGRFFFFSKSDLENV